MAQGRISQLLTSPRVVQLLAGNRDNKEKKSYLRRLVFGNGMLADFTLKLLKDREEEGAQIEEVNEEERLEEIFEDAPGFSSLFDQTNKMMGMS